MHRLVFSLLVTASVAACSSDPRLAELEATQRQQAARATDAKNVVGAIPDWYVKPPAREDALYSAGSAMSLDLALATDKAVLDAKRALVDQLQSKLSNQTKHYVREAGYATANTNDFERTTTTLATDVMVPRYVIEERIVRPEQAGFRVYVLLKYATTPPNLTNSLASNPAFQELSAKVEAARIAATAAPSAKNGAGSPAFSPSQTSAPVIAPPPAVKDEEPPPAHADPRPAVKASDLPGE